MAQRCEPGIELPAAVGMEIELRSENVRPKEGEPARYNLQL